MADWIRNADTRQHWIRSADECLADARKQIVPRSMSMTGHPFQRGCLCVRFLWLAADLYRRAGLSGLADRVEWLSCQSHIEAAWAEFDRMNSGMSTAYMTDEPCYGKDGE